MRAYKVHTDTRRRIEAAGTNDIELQSQTAEARDLEARAIELQGRFADAMRIVEETGAIYRKAAEASPHNIRARRNAIQNHRTLGSLAERVGELSAAKANYERAVALQKELVAEDPRNARMLEDLTALHSNLGSTLLRIGELREAAAQYRIAIGTAESLVARDPRNSALRAALAGANLGLGQTLLETRETDLARTAYETAIRMFDPLAASSPRDVGIQMSSALAHIGAGRIQRDRNDLAQAGQSFRQAANILEKIMPGSGDHRVLSNLGIAYNRLADVYRLQGKSAMAVAAYGLTEPIASLLLAQDPRNAMAYTMRAESLSRVGMIHESSGDWAAALRSYEKAVEMDSKQAERDPRDLRSRENLAGSHFHVCEIRYRLMQYPAALEACSAAVENWRRTQARADLALALGRTGDILLAQATEDNATGVRALACQSYRDAIALSEGELKADVERRLGICLGH